MLFPLILINCEEKKFFFLNNIRALLISFCFVLIDLINAYKNVYSQKKSYIIIITRIINMKRDPESILRFVSLPF